MKKNLLLIVFLSLSVLSWAQSFIPDNLVVYQYGDGVNDFPPTPKSVVPTFLIEYKLNGDIANVIQTKSMPTQTGDILANRILSGAMDNPGEGLLTLSQNGHFLTLIGHNITPDGVAEHSSATEKTIAIVTADGAINTSTAAKGNTFAPFCAVTDNGRNLWHTTNGSGVKYKTEGSGLGAGGDTTLLTGGNFIKFNSVYMYNDELYLTSPKPPKILKLNQKLPYTSNQTNSGLPGYPTSGGGANQTQFVFLDSDTNTPQPDLLYVTDFALNSFQKFAFDGTQWMAKGGVVLTGLQTITDYKITGITGKLENGNVILYAVTPSSLLKFSDNDAINTTVSVVTNEPVVLASSISGKSSFRGVAFTPGTGVIDVATNTDASQFATRMVDAGLITELISAVTISPSSGVQETELQYKNSAGAITAAFFLKVDLGNPNVSLEYLNPEDRNTTGGTLATVSEMVASRNNAITGQTVVAAVNGNYFTGGTTSLGLVVKNETLLKEATQAFYPSLMITKSVKALIGDQYNFRAITNTVAEGIGARYFLMRKGKITADSYREAIDGTLEPRTTVGLLSPTELVFIVVDGRRPGWSVGSSILNLAKIYKAIGATDALNLDGGGSSTFVLRSPSGSYSVKNRPTDAGDVERPVADGLAVLVKNSALPIKLKSFKAVSLGRSSVKLTWITESEANNDYFTLERTLDGQKYELVAKVRGKGNAKNNSQYEFFDKQPYSGTSYYRLKQTDFDGKFTYSNLAPINSLPNSSLIIYPNPVTDQINIRFDILAQDGKITFKVMDASGQLKLNAGGSVSTLNQSINKFLPSLVTGIYYLVISDGINSYSGQFLKK